MQKERCLEKSIMRFVVDNDGLCIKQNALLYKGIPDRLIIGSGFTFFVEIKDEKGDLSTAQKVWGEHLIRMNIPYFVIKSLNEFKEVWTCMTTK